MVPNVVKRTKAMLKHIFTCLESKFQTIHCSKQMWDLLTAVNISKGNHQTIGKLDILCVFLGFGLGLEEKCSILKHLHFGYDIYKKGSKRDEKDKCCVQTCIYCNLVPKIKIPDYTLQ